MAKTERIRQEAPASFGPEEIARQAEQGWKLVAVEWERELPESKAQRQRRRQFHSACRSCRDGGRLEPNSTEQEILFLIMELTDSGWPLLRAIAEELNHRGYRTRQGMKWTPISVFQMLPRLIEVGPRIFATQEWQQRRARLAKTAGR